MEKVLKRVEDMNFRQLRDTCGLRGIDARYGGGAPSVGGMRSALIDAGVISSEVNVYTATQNAAAERPAAAPVVAAPVAALPAPVVEAAPLPSASWRDGDAGHVNGNGHTNGHSNGAAAVAVRPAPAVDLTDDAAALAALRALLGKQSAPLDLAAVKVAAVEVFEDEFNARSSQIADNVSAVAVAAIDSVTADLTAQIDELRAAASGVAPRIIEIKRAETGEVRAAGVQHCRFPLLIKTLSARCHMMLVGEAGSSKTSAAHAAADALGLPFHPMSFGPTTTKTDLLGFMDAHSKYQTTALRRAFEFGGVFCADEIDACSPAALVVINALLANEVAGFPDGNVKRHPDFIVVACANTYGRGADSKFIGRAKLDAATLDRFAVLRWDIDNAFEAHLAGVSVQQDEIDVTAGGVLADAGEWLRFIQYVREALVLHKSEYVASMRATLGGVRLFAAGLGRDWVEEMIVFKGMDEATRVKIRATVDALA